MKNNLEKKLEEWKDYQKGDNLRCPRCGYLSMRPNPIENALSRRYDIYICSQCGTEEAMEDFLGNKMELEDWYFARMEED